MAKRGAGKVRKAGFIEVMECLPVTKIPDGPEWTYEIKLDGYRLQAVKCKGKVTLYSRRKNILNQKFDYIAEALDFLPDETVIDGELVALGPDGSQISICSRTSGRQKRTSSSMHSTS
jgi:ATP-dependent DNA ligase